MNLSMIILSHWWFVEW